MRKRTPFQTAVGTAKPYLDQKALAEAYPAFTLTKIGSKSLYRLDKKQVSLFASYRTIVALFHRDTLYLTSEKFSTTTSKQISGLHSLFSFPQYETLSPQDFAEKLTLLVEQNS